MAVDAQIPDDELALRFRPAQPGDGAALVNLTRACPMQGDISLRIERAPDFFALARCRGDGFTLVAEQKGAIVGCASVARRPAYVAGVPTVTGYVGDVKVHPDYRRAALARRLLREVARLESAAEPALYAGTTAAGNVSVDGLLLRFGEDHPITRLGGFVSYQLFPVLRAPRERNTAIASARPSEEDELAAFLDAAHRAYTFGPVFRDGGLRALLARSPGMSLSDYQIARRGGRIVAALGVWDQHALKQTHVLRMTRAQRWLVRAMRAGALLGLPQLPREGEALRFRYARHAAGETAALASLVHHALVETRARRDPFLLFTCAERDPLARAIARIPRTRYRYGLVVSKNRPYEQQELAALSAALPFDDPALS